MEWSGCGKGALEWSGWLHSGVGKRKRWGGVQTEGREIEKESRENGYQREKIQMLLGLPLVAPSPTCLFLGCPLSLPDPGHGGYPSHSLQRAAADYHDPPV